LLDFEKSIAEFNKRKFQVIAASVDKLEDALSTVERYKITFKVGYGLNVEEISQKLGAFYDKDKGYLHATGFIINPEGKIINGVYSNRSVGRLIAKDCVRLIDHLIEQSRQIPK
jgi:alkyl hydroperoxide reductase subunit AhpC